MIHGPLVNDNINREEVKDKVDKNLKNAALTLNEYESDKRGHRNFVEGEEVLVKVEPQNLKKNGFRYEGPYEIIKFLSPHQVLLNYPGIPKPRRIEWLKKTDAQKN